VKEKEGIREKDCLTFLKQSPAICEAHKRYSQIEVQDSRGQVLNRVRIDHNPEAIRSFFCRFPAGTPIGLESVGNW